MNKQMLNILLEQSHIFDNIIWDDYMVRKDSWGHTWEVSTLNSVHAGRDTTSAYVFGKLTSKIDIKMGISILEAIQELQITDEDDKMHGSFRWYREETRPIDTNAAFFIIAPLTIIRLFAPEYLSREETHIIDRMLKCAYHWFSEECKDSILWYTNKIVSDGALLTCIGLITGNELCKKQARDFLLRWLDYTETRGYGWGENISLSYNSIIIQGFTLIQAALENSQDDIDIKTRFKALEDEILDTFRFNNGYEFIPTIRSYNVEGNPQISSFIYNIAQVGGFGVIDGNTNTKIDTDIATVFLLYGDILYLDKNDYISKNYSNIQAIGRTRVTHIMDDNEAYSWHGKNGGLGSINKFPVIEGSYQNKTWGLGWQCYPVNMIVYDEQVSFLRFNVDDGKRIRCHPHKDKHSTYLDPALFSEHYYPDVKTACKQNKNTLITIRSINKLRNQVKSINDSLDVQRFKNKLYDLSINQRQWVILSYDNANICITPLLGLVSQETGLESSKSDNVNYPKVTRNKAFGATTKNKIEIVKDGDDISLVQWMYKGELKVLFDDRISTAWAIHFIDEKMDKDEIIQYLSDITIIDSCHSDQEVPRNHYWHVHDVQIKYKDEILLEYKYDPYE